MCDSSSDLHGFPKNDPLTPAAFARRVRALYTGWRKVVEEARGRTCDWDRRLMVRWDGLTDPGKPEQFIHAPIWPKILCYALQNRLNVEELIRCAFVARWGKRPADPDIVLTRTALDWYGRFGETGAEATTARLRADLDRFEIERHTSLTAPRASARPLSVERVLLEPSFRCHPLTRYLLAVYGDVDGGRLAARFERAAVWDYLCRTDDYEAIVGGFIPDGFRHGALSLRAAILSQPDSGLEPRTGSAVATDVAELFHTLGAVPRPPHERSASGRRAVEVLPELTGISFVDRVLPDGVRAGNVYGILGAIGAGKTLLATQLAWAAVRRELTLASLWPGYLPRRVYYFSYEMSRDAMVRRLLALAAQIPEDVFEEGWGRREPGRHAYESERWGEVVRFAGEGAVATEAERLGAAQEALQRCLEVVDWSTDENHGEGGLAEITSYLRDAASAGARPPAAVMIDYAGGCVRRRLRATGTAEPDPRSEARLLNNFSQDCRRLVAEPLRCVVWVTHQLAGRVLAEGLGATLDEADAAGGKQFASGTAACLGLSPAHSGTVRLGCLRGSAAGHAVLLGLDGRFGGHVEL
jgi:hypothetical protein